MIPAPLLGGCGKLLKIDPSHGSYPVSDVETRAVSRLPDGSARFEYRVRSETLYYCPGADVQRAGDKALVRLVRAPIDEQYVPDVLAEFLDDGRWLALTVPDAREVAVMIDDGTATRQVLGAPGGPR